MNITEAFKKVSSSKDGISSSQASERLQKYGSNEIKKTRKISPLVIFISQFASPLIIILIAAAVVSFAIEMLPGSGSSFIDSMLIMVIVLAVGISGFFQDWKAERAIEALRKISTPTAVVIREGKEVRIPSTTIVPGDIVVLEAGNVVPADGKIISSFGFSVDESILTGESKTIRKSGGAVLRMNTSVITGRVMMLVFATGMETEVGRLAGKMQEIEDTKTPFQEELSDFSKKIFWMVLGIAAIIMTVGYFRYGPYTAFLTSVSLAVAAIPEGLPAVVTLALAIGAKGMVSRNALVRRLPVVESVGSVNVICTDKTGTLTRNKMTVTKVFFDDVVREAGTIKTHGMEMLMNCGVLCNDAKITAGAKGERTVTGDQTEVAIVEFALSKNFPAADTRSRYRRVAEVPFSSKRKMMSVTCKSGTKKYIFSKGAPEVLLRHCTKVYTGGKVRKLDQKMREKILKQNVEFASNALRVLAFAYREMPAAATERNTEKDLIFLGMEGMLDPPRSEVKEAIKDCRTAGIRVIMITGDNAETAKAIAVEIGLQSKGAISGGDLAGMKDDEIRKRLEGGVNIFARTDPFDKLRILHILQKENRVLMTGDGVNDSLALKKADVGIAMGERGTEVAKEASDIILLDDNFATIRNTVKEGRRIFDNIRKFVNYLLSCNFAEVFVIFMGTMFLSMKEPILLPAQILWINLLTDGLPAIALGMDPPLPDIMKKKPRGKNEGILDRRTLYGVVTMGINMGLLLLAVFFLILPMGIERAQTALFTGFVLYEFLRIAFIRHQEDLNFFDNKTLVLALSVSIILQLLVVYGPVNTYFSLIPLGIYEWTVLLGVGAAGWLSSMGISRLLSRTEK